MEKIVMDPNTLFYERIHPALDLPPRPESFKGHYNPDLFYGYRAEQELPLENRPKKMSRTAQYLGAVEWKGWWAPVYNRLNAYHISTNIQRSHWILWISWLNDFEWKWKLETAIYAYGVRKGINKKTAAIYLLIDAWSFEIENMDLDPFHWLNDEGLLSIEEYAAMARIVWPENQDR